MTELARTIEILSDLIAFPTVSSESNLEMIAYLAQRLEDSGATCRVQTSAAGTKANLFATIGPEEPGGLMLSGHSDVVPTTDQDWHSDPFLMYENEGRLYGRGTCDMKGFIAACVAQAPRYAARDALKRPIHYAFTYDEEIGCLGAQALAPWLHECGIRPTLAIIGEPTSMRVIEGHKGCCEYRTYFQGQSGHGSMPEAGVNAIEYAVRYVSKLMEIANHLKDNPPSQSAFNPPWTTINTGLFQGGNARNTIAEQAFVDWEFRPVSAQDFNHVKTTIEDFVQSELLPVMQKGAQKTGIETQIIGEVEGLIPATRNEARDVMMALTGQSDTELAPFGTEAGIFAQTGMAAIVCGPGSIEQAHKPNEFIAISELKSCLDVLDRLE